MAAAGAEKRLQAMCADVDRACELLLSPSPESLDGCAQILDTAGRRLSEWQPGLREPGLSENAMREPGLLQAQRLRLSVLRAGRLLEGAASFHLNWSRLRDSMSAGYTGLGDPAPVARGHRISLRG